MPVPLPRTAFCFAITLSLTLMGCTQATTGVPNAEANAPVTDEGAPAVKATVPVPDGAAAASQADAAVPDDPTAGKAAVAAAAPAVGPDGKPKKPEPPPLAAADYAGKWQLTDGKTGKICGVTLDKTELKGNLRASNAGCKTVDLTHISGWQLRGRDIVLVNATGEPIAEMKAASENRLDGGLGPGGPNITMWR